MIDKLQPIKDLMKDFPAPWGIAGGWAIGLFLGATTHDHGDVDVAIFRRDQHHLKELFDTHYFNYVLGSRTIKWHGEKVELPIHEFQVHSMDGTLPNMEVHLNETDPIGMRWMFRRNPFITLKADKVFLTNEHGIPFMAPEVVLLFRAKEHQKIDDHGLTVALPALSTESKAWLIDALKNTHPGHPWIELLK